MKYQITLETVIHITKYAISPITCWPPSVGSSRFAVLRHNISLWIGVAHLIASIGSSIYNVYENRNDPSRMIKIISETSAMASATVKMVIWKIETNRLEVLAGEMETFNKEATREEKQVIQSYVNRCLIPHTIIFVSVAIGSIVFIAAPMFTSQRLPGDSAHPFPTDGIWVWAFLYVSQSVCIVQVACMALVDVYCAMLLWYAGARFQILALELQAATNADDVQRCARKHQKLIGYVYQLRASTRIIAVAVVATTLITVTAGGFVLIRRPPFYEFAKYVFYELGTAMELFLFTWPADNLIDVSTKVGDSAYACNWIGKSPEMLKDLSIIIERSRTPIYIAVDGLLPVLSLEFYGSTLVTTFSYLTTLRAFASE